MGHRHDRRGESNPPQHSLAATNHHETPHVSTCILNGVFYRHGTLARSSLLGDLRQSFLAIPISSSWHPRPHAGGTQGSWSTSACRLSSRRIRISCSSGPYIYSRYDTPTWGIAHPPCRLDGSDTPRRVGGLWAHSAQGVAHGVGFPALAQSHLMWVRTATTRGSPQ